MSKCISILFLTLAVTFASTTVRGSDLSYTNWPSEPEWVDLTNALEKCYVAIVARCEVAGVSTNGFAPPSFIYPADDYRRCIEKIEQLCPKFVCTTNFGADGTLDDYFATGATNYTFSMWTSESLLDDLGFTSWSTNTPLTLWQAADHGVQTQLVCALDRLIWTKKDISSSPIYREWVGYGFGHSYSNWAEAKLAAETDWELDGVATAGMGSTCYRYNGQYSASLHTWQQFFRVMNLSTNFEHEVQYYLYATHMVSDLYSATSRIFDDWGLSVRLNRYTYHASVTSQLATVDSPMFGKTNMPMPWCDEAAPGDSHACRGFYNKYRKAIVRWEFPDLTNMPPTVYEQLEVPDSDRDDIVELAGDISAFGPDTGTMFWTPEQETPYVMLPIARTPLWSGSFPVHAYLCEGGTTNLPFQYLVQGLADNDGHYQAYSLNTRIIESGFITNATSEIKRAAVLRPRGNVVIFDFAWDDGSAAFEADGYPIGINRNRTYVLRDTTPDNHTDKVFDLYFESGIVHHFAGAITSISDEVGMHLPVSADAIPGASITLTNNASDAKYDVALTWTEGQLTDLAYTSKDDASTITVDVEYDADNAMITGLTKIGLNGSDASLSGNTITYDWGTVSRTESGGDVTITTTLDDGGIIVEEYEINDARRVTGHTLTANGDNATTIYEYYDSASGRYDNGTPKNAKLKKVTAPDGSSVEYTYAADTGWLTQEKRPVGNGSDRYTTYAYSHAGDSTANATNLYERPRTVSERYGATTIGKTYYAYTGPVQTEIQDCATAGAAWDAASNLVTINTYATDGLTNGLILSASTPLGTSTFSYEIAGLSGSAFTALGKLTAASVHSTGQTVTNVVNAFGTREKAVTVDTDSGQTTASAISTVDAFGRPTQTTFLDGTSKAYASWTLHGPETVTGIDSSDTTYAYYDNGRVKQIDRGDTGLLLEYEYDALGNLTSATATGDDATSVSSSASYDAQARPVSRTDLLGTTTYAYDNETYGVETTITYEDGGVLTRERYHDGSVKQITGTAAKAKRQYEYGIDGGLFFAKQIRPVGGATTEWTKNTFDALGNVSSIEHSGAGGDTTTLSFDAKGRIDGWEDEEGIARVFTYTVRNEIQDAGLDFNGDGSLAAASRDRYLTSAYGVTASGSKYSGTTYPTDNSSNAELLAEIEVALDGAQITSTYAGRTDTHARSGYSSGGSYFVTNSLSDGTKLVQEYEAWRLKKTKRYESGSGTPWETETLTYDGLGSLVEVDNSRNGVTDLEYDDARRLAKVTLPDPAKLPIEIKYWDGTDRIKSIRRTDGSYLRFDYYPNGLLQRRYDLGTYDITYAYDDQGRRTTQTTDRDGTPVDTEWIYDSASGQLDEKKIAGVIAETYTHRDNGQIATITDANGVVATHAYNEAGDLAGITYTDGTTAPITSHFNRFGQIAASGQGGVSNAFVYSLDGQIMTNTVTGSGIVPDAQLAYTYGSTHAGLASASFTVGGATRSVTVDRNARKLVSSLADGNVTAEYTYESGAPFVNAVTVKVDSVTAMTRTIGWDAVNDRITNITCTVGGSNVASFAYTWQTNANRIASVTQADGSYWVYDYDTRGHLTSGERFHADGTPYFGLQYGAAFDSIGNTLEGGPLAGGVPEHSFTPNDLNVHVSRAWSNKVELLGRAATNTTVTVNAAPTDRAGEWFRAIITVDNAASAVETNVTITAVWFDAVASNDVVASTTGSVLVAKAGEVPDYDNRASMTGSSRFENTFDAFGLLVEVVNTAVIPNVRETYTYFADGRRSTKKTYRGSTGDWTNTFSHAFIYDDWSLIHERITDELLAATTTREYVWGLDLVGQRSGEIGQEAGGIGGLLAIRQIEGGVTNVYLPIADHIGNVMYLVDADSGEVVANYLYSPYGVLAGAWGEAKDACPFRFQSKYMDAETGLYYFGYRFYEPASVKWITRDPLGEEGGINLTAAFGCDPINMYDRFGLAALNNLNSRLLFKPAEINQMFSPLAEAKDDFEKMQLGYFGLFGAAVTAPTWGGFAVDAVAEVTGLPISPRDIPDLARAAWHLPSNIRRVGTALRKPGIGSQLLSKLRFWKRGGDDVIERMAPKMKTVLGNGADVGPFRGKSGYNVLDMDRTLPLDSRKAININWLDDAIEQGDDIILKTDPIEWDRFMRDIGKESFYNEVELPHLMKRGVIDDVILDY